MYLCPLSAFPSFTHQRPSKEHQLFTQKQRGLVYWGFANFSSSPGVFLQVPRAIFCVGVSGPKIDLPGVGRARVSFLLHARARQWMMTSWPPEKEPALMFVIPLTSHKWQNKTRKESDRNSGRQSPPPFCSDIWRAPFCCCFFLYRLFPTE